MQWFLQEVARKHYKEGALPHKITPCMPNNNILPCLKHEIKLHLYLYFRYAARAIRCVINFKSLVDSESLPVDMLGPHPMCMMQYKNLLSSCRIPHTQRDTRVRAAKGEDDRHIIVMHNSNVCKHNMLCNL